MPRQGEALLRLLIVHRRGACTHLVQTNVLRSRIPAPQLAEGARRPSSELGWEGQSSPGPLAWAGGFGHGQSSGERALAVPG